MLPAKLLCPTIGPSTFPCPSTSVRHYYPPSRRENEQRPISELFRRDGVVRRRVELGQPENEDLGWRLGLEGGFIASFAEHRGVVAIGLAGDPPVAGEHEVNLAAGCRHPGLRGKTQKARLAAPLGEDAHHKLADAGDSLDRHPVEMFRAHHDG